MSMGLKQEKQPLAQSWACALPWGGQQQGLCFSSSWSRCLCRKQTTEHQKLESLSLLKKQACIWNIKIFQICLCKVLCPAHACAVTISPNSKNVDVLHNLVGLFPISYLHEQKSKEGFFRQSYSYASTCNQIDTLVKFNFWVGIFAWTKWDTD